MDPLKSTIATYNELAQAYQDKFMDFDLYDDTYELFCELMRTQNPQIFEIGCGPGNITRYLLRKRPDFNILGIDLAPNMVALARQNNPTAKFEVMDCREMERLTRTFDGIVCGFCLPYLSKTECRKLITDCSALLHTYGLFYFSFIEDLYDKSGIETSSNGQHHMYIYCHEADDIMENLGESDLETISVIRKKYPKPDGSEAVHTIIIAKKLQTNHL